MNQNLYSNGAVPQSNPSYPMAGLQGSTYAPPLNYNKPTEVVGGYDAKINPMTGEEMGQTNFARGGQINPEAGVASLLASRGRNGDSMLVHMTPGEVQGLQAIALATGGSLTINPNTGLVEAGWLKNLLPAIAGAGLQSLFGNKMGSALTSAVVGAATGLIEKSFDKGMRAGLSAYSGAKITEGLRAANEAILQQRAIPQIVGGAEEVSNENLRNLDRKIDLSKLKVEVPPIRTTTQQPSVLGDMWGGIKGLMKPEGQEAFMSAIEGPYKSDKLKDISRSAVFAGLANLFAEDPKKIPTGGMSKPRYYIPGERNPRYGQGYNEWYFQPGYYSDTYPGYAEGGMISGEEHFADGGDVTMVSPGAILPQQIPNASPFTQDRAGLQSYYESLLVPPDNTPRDTSQISSYLDFLRDSLKKPYKPVSGDWDYTPIPTGPTPGGGGGGTPAVPGGPDPYATLPGTPIDLIGTGPKTPETPTAPTAPPERELLPPTNVVRPITPGQLGDLVTTPPQFDTGVDEDSPETETSIVVDPEFVAPDYEGAPIIPITPGGTASGPPGAGGVKAPASKDVDTKTSIEVLEGELAKDYTGVPASYARPGSGELSTPERTGSVKVSELSPAQLMREERLAADALERQLYKDAGGLGMPGFAPPSLSDFAQAQPTQQVADASKPIVDEILKNFDEQQKAEEKEKEAERDAAVQKAKDIGMGIAGQAIRSVFPAAGVLYDLYQAATKDKGKDDKGEQKATVEVKTLEEIAKEEKEKEEAAAKAKADAAAASGGGGGGSAIPFVSTRNYTLRDLINPVESEEGLEPDREYAVGVEGMAGGGSVPRFAGGGLGSLQQYAVGGKLVNGAGDGMSDDIKANISGVQEARLADGEFVIPADVVSHLGNGSTDAGAKQLYAMMDRIRKARTGRSRQAPEVNARKYMPA